MEIASPALYVPFAVLDVTFVTVPAVVSITIALFALSELAAPGVARVRVAALAATSCMVPPFSASAVVAT